MNNQYRGARLEGLLRQELNNLLEKDFESPLGSLITITAIDIHNGSQDARIGVSIIPEKFAAGVIKNLNGFAPELHYKLIRKMDIRTVPKLDFFNDPGAENAAKLEKLIMENKKEFEGGDSLDKPTKS